jgi:autotransporter-associated beta strand protein
LLIRNSCSEKSKPVTTHLPPNHLPNNPMKPCMNPFLRSAALAASFLIGYGSASAAIYQWDGGAGTSNWSDANNWNPDIVTPYPTGFPTFNNDPTPQANRLNVNGAQKLVYTSAEGNTLYSGDPTAGTGGGRGLTIGNVSSGTMEISGGSFSTFGSAGGDIIGNGNNSTGILTINGGTFIGTNAGTNLGIGTGTGRVSTLNVSSGKATLAGLNLNSSDADVNLSGTGELEVNSITMTAGSTGNISFDGGTLRSRATTTTFLQGLSGATVNGGGVTIDTTDKNITIGQALLAGAGTGGLTKTGSGALTLSGTNTYAGATTLSQGTISVGAAANLGAAASNLVFDGGTLRITGATLTNFSGIGHSVSFNSGKNVGLDINASTTTFTADQVLNQGAGGLTKLGAGKLVLNQNNTYSGDTTISAGALIKDAADSTDGDITVANGASLVLRGGVTDGAGQTVTLTGGGINTGGYFFTGSAVLRGALQGQTGSNTWAGDVVVNNARIGVQDGASLTLTGDISESVVGSTLLFRAGNAGSNITLSGTGSWTGFTTLFSSGGSIRLTDNDRISTAASVDFTSGGTTVLDLNGFSQEFAGINSGEVGLTGATIQSSAANATLKSNTATSTSFNYKGVISDGAGSLSFVKLGQGAQTLSGINTYTGDTTVTGGTLTIASTGSLAAGSDVTVGNTASLNVLGTVNGTVLVDDGGTLKGNGGQFNSAVTINGTHAPGSSPGLQTFNNGLTYGSSGILNAEFVGDTLAVRGTDYDGINVTGGNLSIDLASIFKLTATSVDYTNALWDSARSFTVIDFSGLGTSTGVFTLDTSLAGSFDSEGGWSLGNTDNDIVLTWAPIPEPSVALLATLGTFGLLLRRRVSR